MFIASARQEVVVGEEDLSSLLILPRAKIPTYVTLLALKFSETKAKGAEWVSQSTLKSCNLLEVGSFAAPTCFLVSFLQNKWRLDLSLSLFHLGKTAKSDFDIPNVVSKSSGERYLEMTGKHRQTRKKNGEMWDALIEEIELQ